MCKKTTTAAAAHIHTAVRLLYPPVSVLARIINKKWQNHVGCSGQNQILKLVVPGNVLFLVFSAEGRQFAGTETTPTTTS